MLRISLGRVVGVLAVVGWSGFFFYLGYDQSALVEQRKAWPSTEGVVLDSKTVEWEDRVEYKVTFSYEIEGIRYENSDFFDEFDAGDHIPDRHRPDRRVSVFYNPDDPGTAVLDPAGKSQAWVLYLLGTIPILIALPFLLYWGLMAYVRYQMSVARYHLDQARTLIAEGTDALRAHAKEGGVVDEEVASKAVGLMSDVEQVEALLSGLDREIAAEGPQELTSEEDASDGGTRIAQSDDQPQSVASTGGTASGFGTALLAAIVPLVLGGAISWLAPYYAITCTRSAEGNVDVEIQQVLYALIPVGEPARISNLNTVGDFREGSSRTKKGYLRFEGDTTLEIRATRGMMSVATIQEFLASSEVKRLQLSDGGAFFGLFVPWAVGLFGLVAALIAISDGKLIPSEHQDFNARQLDPANPIPSATLFLVQFVMGGYVTACLAGLIFVDLIDVVRASALNWLILSGLIAVGGSVNVIRSQRRAVRC